MSPNGRVPTVYFPFFICKKDRQMKRYVGLLVFGSKVPFYIDVPERRVPDSLLF